MSYQKEIETIDPYEARTDMVQVRYNQLLAASIALKALADEFLDVAGTAEEYAEGEAEGAAGMLEEPVGNLAEAIGQIEKAVSVAECY